MAVSDRAHSQINTVSTLVLFKACFGLLKASTSAPKFVVMSSVAGSIAREGSFTQGAVYNAPYGMTKAAVNYLARKLHTEHAADGLGELLCRARRDHTPSHHP
jgi:NAD(P)-dependent dehydrogenase (short-subunit alcohol dehydrogenase family)